MGFAPIEMSVSPHGAQRRQRNMSEFKFTRYFEEKVLKKRSYLRKEWCIKVVEEPLKVEAQEDNRYRFWGTVPELRGRVLRVVTLKDKRTIHNAFPDRRFKG